MNRLADSRSSYLLQHKDNPVDWQEWSPEAFEEAARRDVPVLLSVGYAACHWCHVMAHESFEDPAVASVMNAGFVCVKVDRQERPDVDSIYMQATLAMTGSGGWPMTCFLTSEGKPFYCGTYFPPQPRAGLPGFTQLLDAVTQTWAGRREEIDDVASRVTAQLEIVATTDDADPTADGTAVEAAVDAALAALERDEDTVHGGLGGAPKFPPSTVLELLARAGERRPAARALARRTLQAMARSGMADQLGGGFARYAVDAGWVVPHFEKMLYDNALLLRSYALAANDPVDPEFRRVAVATAEFLLGDLLTDVGLFAAALDADTGGVEGATYVWTPDQLDAVLGQEDGRWAAEVFGVTAAGTFEDGASTLRLLRPVDQDAPTSIRFDRVRAALARARAARVQPGRDELVVASWNGLAVSALAIGGALLGERRWVEAATTAARAIVDVHEIEPGVLVRASRDGRPGVARGVLEDYGYAAAGMLDLFAVTGQRFAVEAAGRFIHTIGARFAIAGELRDTDDAAPALLVRPGEVADNATPAARSVAADALVRYAAMTGESDAMTLAGRALARRALAPSLDLAARAPRAVCWGLAVAYSARGGPVEVAIVGDPDAADTRALVAVAAARPGLAVATGRPGSAGGSAPADPAVELLADRGLVDGRATAYVCRGFVCERPVTDPGELAESLSRR